MKRLLILIIVLVASIALLLAGCTMAVPEIPECPDCICPELECPACCCPDACPDECPNCNCPEIPAEEPPVIIEFEADKYSLFCGVPYWPTCEGLAFYLSWVVVGADTVEINADIGYPGEASPDIGYVGAIGSAKICCKSLAWGDTTFLLTATNGAGVDTADVVITRIEPPQ